MANTPISSLINEAARLVVDKNMIRGPKQQLPDEANRIINVLGNKDGPALTGSIDLKMMNDYRPEWRTQTPADTIQAGCMTNATLKCSIRTRQLLRKQYLKS